MEKEARESTEEITIYGATEALRNGLQRCLSVHSLMQDDWAENRLMDFNLWASGVGVTAVPPATLDQRLDSQPDIRAVVLGLLATLTTMINLCLKLGTYG